MKGIDVFVKILGCLFAFVSEPNYSLLCNSI